jgi:hypothetical protein
MSRYSSPSTEDVENEQARGGDPSAGQQIRRHRFARDQMLIDMVKDVERKAGIADSPTTPPEAPRLGPADEEVIQGFVEAEQGNPIGKTTGRH